MTPRAPIIRVIAYKELRETLRDRRTLFRMVLVPILLYPAMLLVISQVASARKVDLERTPSRVAVAAPSLTGDDTSSRAPNGAPNAPNAPNAPPDAPSDARDAAPHPVLAALRAADKLSVIALPLPPAAASAPDARDATDARDASDTQDTPAPPSALTDDIARRLASEGADKLDAAVVVTRWPTGDDDTGEVAVHFSSVDDRSRLAATRVEDVLDALRDRAVADRLTARGLPPSLARPLTYARLDRSDRAQRGGHLLGLLLPMFVVVTVMLGAIYPAIDLTAGEKERRSLQTLLTAPISVLEVVLGKYCAVFCVSLLSGLINLLSMALVFGYVGGQMMGGEVEVALGVGPLGVLLVATALIAALISGLALAIAISARDFKDAQNLLAPLLILLMVPSLLIQLPGFELTPVTAMIPVVNALLLMKRALMAQGVSAQALFLVVTSLCAATALALLAATRIFAQERVMAGERGQFNLLAAPRDIEPKPRPSVAEAIAWVSVLFVLLFYGGGALQSLHPQWGLLATLWLVIALPTWAVSRYLKLDVRETFRLRKASPRHLLAAVALGSSAWVLVAYLHALMEAVLPMPPEVIESLQRALPSPTGVGEWAALLLVAALSPALCEEAVFRGFLFSSLRGRVPAWAVIVITAVAFGLFHMSIYRLMPTVTLGLILGLLAYRSDSIWPAVVFHGCNNAVALTLTATWLGARGDVPVELTIGAGFLCALGLALLRSAPPVNSGHVT
jgi:sodium transport system permease protein